MLTGWFGAPGSLIPVAPNRGEVSEKDARTVTERITFSGQRHVQIGAGSARSWSLKVSGSPADLAPLKFASTKPEPWVWVSPVAQVSNLLTPGQSMLENAGDAVVRGALDIGSAWVSQWAAGHATSTVSVTGGKPAPVRPGEPVTISAWVQRSDPDKPVQMVFGFLNSAGSVIFTTTRDSPAGSQLQRASWTVVPPEGSASVTVVFRYAATLAAPQVTWGSGAPEYSEGRGVYRVVVTSWTEDLETILPDGSLWLSASMTLLEVG